MMKRFYVVEHINGAFSIQTDPDGAAELLQAPLDPQSRYEATLVCYAANMALDSVGMLDPKIKVGKGWIVRNS